MDRNEIIELLKNYPSYKQAIHNFESHMPEPSAAVANYNGMPSGKGAPEFFFAPVGRMADIGTLSLLDVKDYQEYKYIVNVIESTIENVLSDNERKVIKYKWLNRNSISLAKIAIMCDKHENTVKYWHKEALKKLSISFSLMKKPAPKIEQMIS